MKYSMFNLETFEAFMMNGLSTAETIVLENSTRVDENKLHFFFFIEVSNPHCHRRRQSYSPKSSRRKMANMRRALINLHRSLSSAALPNWSSISPASSSSCVRTETLLRPQYGWVSRFSSDSINNNTQSLDIDLSSEDSKRRLFNRLIYRSKQRGFLELDLVLGKWVEEHIHSMDESGIKALVYVLDLENPDLWKWLTGQEQPPEAVNLNPVFRALHNKVMNNLNSHAAPETRAVPGQPWVRGWDDFKKGKDSPITGNQ